MSDDDDGGVVGGGGGAAKSDADNENHDIQTRTKRRVLLLLRCSPERKDALRATMKEVESIRDICEDSGIEVRTFEEAKRKHEACLKMRYAIYGTDKAHPSIATSLSNLGGVLKDLGDLEEAKRKYEACLKMECRIYAMNESHPEIKVTRDNLERVIRAIQAKHSAKSKET